MGKQYVKKPTGLGVCSVGQLQVLTYEKPMTKVPVTSTALEQFGHALALHSVKTCYRHILPCTIL